MYCLLGDVVEDQNAIGVAGQGALTLDPTVQYQFRTDPNQGEIIDQCMDSYSRQKVLKLQYTLQHFDIIIQIFLIEVLF